MTSLKDTLAAMKTVREYEAKIADELIALLEISVENLNALLPIETGSNLREYPQIASTVASIKMRLQDDMRMCEQMHFPDRAQARMLKQQEDAMILAQAEAGLAGPLPSPLMS